MNPTPPTINAQERMAVARAISDPGATEGYKGERTLTEWQTDAVMRVLSAASSGERGAALEAAWAMRQKALDVALIKARLSALEEAANKCIEQAEVIGAQTGSSIWNALYLASSAIRALATPTTVEEPKI